MRKTNYFGVKIASPSNSKRVVNRFNPKSDAPARMLGDTIVESIRYGSTPSVTIPVTFDEDDAEGVDIMSSPNKDFFDIAEEVGKVVDLTSPNPANEPVNKE